MYIKILGSAAGGGFPQWNCFCDNCQGIRNGTLRATKRTQSSIAISRDQKKWLLINASPDIHQQIVNITPQQSLFVRENPIAGVMLLDSQLDHTAGLLLLREGKPLKIYATAQVFEDLTDTFPVIKMLSNYSDTILETIALNQHFTIPELENIHFQAIPLTGKAPPYSLYRDQSKVGHNIALVITDLENKQQLFYAPGLGEITPALFELMQAMNCLLIDGTFWQEDEMLVKVNKKRLAKEMGHLPLSGKTGLLSFLIRLKTMRKILIHINNTNPILNTDSKEYAELVRLDIEVAYDNMRISL